MLLSAPVSIEAGRPTLTEDRQALTDDRPTLTDDRPTLTDDRRRLKIRVGGAATADEEFDVVLVGE